MNKTLPLLLPLLLATPSTTNPLPRHGSTAPVDPSLPLNEIGSSPPHPGDVRWCCSLGVLEGRQNIWCNYNWYSNPPDQGGSGGAKGSGGGQSNAGGPEPAAPQSAPLWQQPLQDCNMSVREKTVRKKRRESALGDEAVVGVTNGVEVVDVARCRHQKDRGSEHQLDQLDEEARPGWTGHPKDPDRSQRMGWPAPIGSSREETRDDIQEWTFHQTHEHSCLDGDPHDFHDANHDCYKHEGVTREASPKLTEHQEDDLVARHTSPHEDGKDDTRDWPLSWHTPLARPPPVRKTLDGKDDTAPSPLPPAASR